MIENADFSPEELERRKHDKIEYRKKQRASNIFILASTLIQIVETLIILCLLLWSDLMIMFKVIKINDESGPTILQFSFFILFFVGLVLGFFAYKYTMKFIVTKFDLSGKLLDTTIEHYKFIKKNRK